MKQVPAGDSLATPTPVACVNVFVSERGNEFMRDIARALVEAAAQNGRQSTLVTDRLPEVDGSINLVVAPHEFFTLSDAATTDLQRAAAASVCVCTEQPGTPWFRLSVEAARRGLATLDINEHGVQAMRAAGIAAHRLRFGAVPSMSAGDRPPRDIDLLFMGSLDSRRGAALASIAPLLWDRRSELRLFPFDKPVGADAPGVAFGAAKFQLLRRAHLLLNVHRDRSLYASAPDATSSYFEWVRLVEAMANGCVVVTERSLHHDPLVAGSHFVEAELSDLGDVIGSLLADEPRRLDIARAAERAVTVDFSLSSALQPVLDHLESVVVPHLGAHVDSGSFRKGSWRAQETRPDGPRLLGPFRPFASILSRAKQIALAESNSMQRLEAIRTRLRGDSPEHVDRTQTPAYAAANADPAHAPEVSVLVTLYNLESLVTETLDSIVASTDVDFEVLIVEDHATDRSRAVALDYLHRHPGHKMVLLTKEVNEGLAAARNTGIAASRAPFVMVMDADNCVYPTCLRRLADALHREDDAAFAYSILEDFGSEANVRSAFAWNPSWLCAANYIDAQAMIRREVFASVGGYRTDDPLIFGWEDWELWLRLASMGHRGALVPEMLGRYRVQADSMIGLTNLWTDESIARMRELHPSLPWPA